MKKIIAGCVMLFVMGLGQANSADVKVHFPINEALEQERIKAVLNPDIALYWGDQKHPRIKQDFGTFKTSKRTNGFGKSRSSSCSWGFASAIKELQDRAEKEGGNAVVNIVSNIKDRQESSQTEYSCLAGFAMVNVALKGKVVTLAK